MALLKYGGGVVQMSGSIAGNTFARNRSGNYARARTTPVNPRTALQTAVRTIVSVLTAAWYATLTASQRTAWGTYAAGVAMKNKLGEVIYLTGFNHYVRANAPLLQADKTRVDDAPVVLELPSQDNTAALAADVSDNKIKVTFDNTAEWATEAGGFLHVLMGQPQNVTRNFFNGPYRYAGSVVGATPVAPTSPAELTPPFTLIAGQKVWCQLRVQRADGRLSEPFRVDCTVTS